MMNKFIGTEKEIKGVALVDATEPVSTGTALDQAYYSEGEVYVYHPDFFIAEEKARLLNEELHQELADIAATIQTGKKTVSGLVELGYADDIIAAVNAHLKPVKKPATIVSQEEIVSGLKQAGLEMGMTFPFAGAIATITGFEATNEGVYVTLDVAGKTHKLHAVKVLEIKNNPIKEEKQMKQLNVTKVQEAQGTVVADELDQLVAEMEEEETQAEKIARSAKAQRLIQQAAARKAAQEAAKAAQQKQKEEEAKMAQQQPKTNEVKKEETKVEGTTRKGTTAGRMGAGNTGTTEGKGNRPSQKLGTLPTQTASGPVSEELASKIYDEEPEAVERLKGGMWFRLPKYSENVLWDEILETRANPALGITNITIRNPKTVKNAKDAIAYVGVTIANAIELRFKFGWNKKQDAKCPIDTQNIDWNDVWVEEKGSYEYRPVYAFYRSNAKQYKVICQCKKWNDIREIGKPQNCVCGREVGVREEVYYTGGELKDSNVVLQYLPNGAGVNPEVLAQVMAYAYMRLVPLMEEEGHSVIEW